MDVLMEPTVTEQATATEDTFDYSTTKCIVCGLPVTENRFGVCTQVGWVHYNCLKDQKVLIPPRRNTRGTVWLRDLISGYLVTLHEEQGRYERLQAQYADNPSEPGKRTHWNSTAMLSQINSTIYALEYYISVGQ